MNKLRDLWHLVIANQMYEEEKRDPEFSVLGRGGMLVKMTRSNRREFLDMSVFPSCFIFNWGLAYSCICLTKSTDLCA